MKGYLQTIFNFPTCKNGKLYIYVAGETTPCIIYDYINQNPRFNPVSIDVDGYAEGFLVDDDYIYDIRVVDYLGATQITRENIAVGGGAGDVGPKGDKGDKGDTGDKGDKGDAGTDGTDGTNGTNGTDGTDGISLLSIRVDDSTSTGTILYNLSSDPSLWYDAGSITPDGIGLVSVSSTDTPDYLTNKIFGTDGAVTITATANSLTFNLDSSLLTRLDDIDTMLADHESRIDVLEAASYTKQVIFGGAIGETTVVIPHSLGTSNLAVTCYNGIDNSVIFLSVIVTDTQVSIQGLTPLTVNNQIKVVLIK